MLAGRFVGVLRALVPALAGMAAMPYRVFVAWELAGALVWAPGLVLAGYAAGSSQRAAQATGQAGVLLAGSLIVLATVVAGARWAARHRGRIVAAARRQLARPPLARLISRYRAQLEFLAARFRPGGALGLSLSIGLLLVGSGPRRCWWSWRWVAPGSTWGVHWPTDVLGGWALGGLWLAVVLVVWTALERIRPLASPTPAPVDDVDLRQEGRVHAGR